MFSKIRHRLRYLNAQMLVYTLAAFGLGALIWLLWPGRNTPAPLHLTQPVRAAPTGGASVSYADTVARVSPSVVTVLSEKRPRLAQPMSFPDAPLFRQFFGGRMPAPEIEHGLGSGVIVNSDGTILTNNHVVDGAQQVKVVLSDHRTLSAKVVGTDAPSDLAVLKVDARDLPALPLGDSDAVRVGDVALAVGNPLGIGQTVTSGIISAKGRATSNGDGSFEDFLQTDAPINHGNSGGALVNTDGQLIGINSQILSPSGGSIGIGFAIPSNLAQNVMTQLLRDGKVHRGQLGIGIQDVNSDLAASLNLPDAHGVLVNAVKAGSPAAKAGLQQGDVIIALEGQPVEDGNSLRNHVAATQPGSNVTLTIRRDGQEQQIKVALGEYQPPPEKANGSNSGGGDAPTGKLGVSVAPLTPEIASRIHVNAGTQGVVIEAVDPSGPAAAAGLHQDDVMVSVNRKLVKSADQVEAALDATDGKPVLLLINRGGSELFVTVQLAG